MTWDIIAGEAERASDLFVERERRLRVGSILLFAKTGTDLSRIFDRCHMRCLLDAIVGVVRIWEDRQRGGWLKAKKAMRSAK